MDVLIQIKGEKLRTLIMAVVGVIAALMLGVLLATPASASGSGNCSGIDACLYFNSNLAGAKYGDPRGNTRSVENYSGYFGGGNGAGVPVKNNAASVRNLNINYYVKIYYNSNYGGPSQMIPAGKWQNLNATLKNNNASQCFDFYNPCP